MDDELETIERSDELKKVIEDFDKFLEAVRGIHQGIGYSEGRRHAELHTKRNVILRLIELKFGDLDVDTYVFVKEARDEKLDKIIDLFVRARSIKGLKEYVEISVSDDHFKKSCGGFATGFFEMIVRHRNFYIL